MPTAHCEIFRRHARPLAPVPSDHPALPARLAGVRAVLFDLYGTLLISASGEVGTARRAANQDALRGALDSVGVDAARLADGDGEVLFDAIEASHAQDRARGIAYPEVEIAEVWRRALAELERRGAIDPAALGGVDLERLAVEYEARANPVWPMPGAADCLAALHRSGILLGIVSNAQFYTAALFPAFLGTEAEDLGFDPRLVFYSHQHGLAKPGPGLFQMAADELGRRGIEPAGAVYVGNDMLNDVLPARQVGFRTVLFAGDARSLRLRQDDPRVTGVVPDAVVASLAELVECVGAPAA